MTEEVVIVAEPEQGASETQVSVQSTTVPAPTHTSEDASQTDTPDVPMRPAEKKRLHWKGKTCKFCSGRIEDVSTNNTHYQIWRP